MEERSGRKEWRKGAEIGGRKNAKCVVEKEKGSDIVGRKERNGSRWLKKEWEKKVKNGVKKAVKRDGVEEGSGRRQWKKAVEEGSGRKE